MAVRLSGRDVGSALGRLPGTILGSDLGCSRLDDALAANGANCSAGSYPLGVDASGAAEGCTVAGGAEASPA